MGQAVKMYQSATFKQVVIIVPITLNIISRLLKRRRYQVEFTTRALTTVSKKISPALVDAVLCSRQFSPKSTLPYNAIF